MTNKKFISILGSSNYKECRYTDPETGHISEPVRFVQVASLLLGKEEWTAQDQIVIFVTEGKNGSRIRNWEDNGQPGVDGFLPGLKTCLEYAGLKAAVKAVSIPEVLTEDDVWKVFDKIYDEVESGDRIYFDITHGFRFLPMIVLVLGNYAKYLKKTEVLRISYGNFEGRSVENNQAQIIDLTNLVLLQSWTQAASEFTSLGKTFGLSKLIQGMANKHRSDESREFIKLSNALKQLEGDFYTVRGKNLVSGEVFLKLRISLEKLRKSINTGPLMPLLNEIQTKVDHFNPKSDILNGFKAVDWCIQHKLIQQGYTLAQEVIISYLCQIVDLDPGKRNDREYLGMILGIAGTKKENCQEKWNKLLAEHHLKSTELFNLELIQNIANPYRNLSSLRNTLNHAGFHGNESYQVFAKNFIKLYGRCLKVLNEHGLEFHSPFIS